MRYKKGLLNGREEELNILNSGSKILIMISFILVMSPQVYGQQKVPSPWAVETVDDTGDVGKWPCLDLDSSDTPHIVYMDSGNNRIKYAVKEGGFWNNVSETKSDVLGYIAMALDSNNLPRVVYSGTGAGADYELVYSSYNGRTWGWESMFNAFWYDNSKDKSIVVDSNGFVYISFHEEESAGGGVKFIDSYKNQPGYWTSDIETNSSEGNVIGMGNSIALSDTGRLFVSYVDKTGALQRVKCKQKTRNEDPPWYDLTGGNVDETADSKGDVTCTAVAEDTPHIVYTTFGDIINVAWDDGFWVYHYNIDSQGSPYVSIAVREIGRPHIVYYDAGASQLKYAHYDGNNWVFEVIDEYLGVYSGAGCSPSIKVDSAGNVHVAYYDAASTRLKYAFRSGSAGIPELIANEEVLIGNNLMDMDDPDPQRRKCRIMYNLDRDQEVTIKVYDLTGNLVKTLFERQWKTAGPHGEDEWAGTSIDDFHFVGSGIYYIVVEGEGWTRARKVAVVRRQR